MTECFLDRPTCKRTLMSSKEPFQKESCPLSEKPKCALAPPTCPLLPEDNRCPLKLINEITQAGGCQNMVSGQPNGGAVGGFECWKKGDNMPPCTKCSIIAPVKKDKDEIQKKIVKSKVPVFSSRRPFPCSDCLKALLECPLNAKEYDSSLVYCKARTTKCPFVQIIDMCEDQCLCTQVPRIDTGPECPFMPKSCQCCQQPRCPLQQLSHCPLIEQAVPKQKTFCPCNCLTIPSPCSLGVGIPQCPLVKEVNCPLSTARKELSEPVVIEIERTITKYDSPQMVQSSRPEFMKSIKKTSKLGNRGDGLVCKEILRNVEVSLQSNISKQSLAKSLPKATLADMKLTLRKKQNAPPLCKAPERCCLLGIDELEKFKETISGSNYDFLKEFETQSPQVLNTFDTMKNEFGVCSCGMDCPNLDQPEFVPRNYHVPTCNHSKRLNLPRSRVKGDKVCPYSPSPCPLGPVCPFPVSTQYDPNAPPIPKSQPIICSCQNVIDCPLATKSGPSCPLDPIKYTCNCLVMPKEPKFKECPLSKPKPVLCKCCEQPLGVEENPTECLLKALGPPKSSTTRCPLDQSQCPKAQTTESTRPSEPRKYTSNVALVPEIGDPPKKTAVKELDKSIENVGTADTEPSSAQPESSGTFLEIDPIQPLKEPVTAAPDVKGMSKLANIEKQGKRATTKNVCQLSNPCPLGPGKTEKQDSENDSGCLAVKLLNRSKNLNCPVKTKPCDMFPKGRCPMTDLSLCKCDYPVSPCLAPAQCGDVVAPMQYCYKEDCCMGLTLPPTYTSKKYERGTYYAFKDWEPGSETTKHYVEFLDQPPESNYFKGHEKRQHDNWSVITFGKGYESCIKVQELLLKRGSANDSSAQFLIEDNPLDVETKLIIENKKNRKKYANTPTQKWMS